MSSNLKTSLKSLHKEILKKTRVQQYNHGLVLSGGAAHGFAHVGVIKALQELDSQPEIISGVSAGSIVGSFYADGFQPEEIYEIFDKNKIFSFVKIKPNKHGLFDISGLKKILKNNLRTRKIEDLKKPLIIGTTNISKGITVYFEKGDLVNTVVASSSIPVLFKPVKIADEYYVDGGVTDNFPVQPLKDICNKITGVNVNPLSGFNSDEIGLVQLAIYSFHLSVSSGIRKKKKYLTNYIEPKELVDFSYINVNMGKTMMEIGYNETKKVI